MNVPFSLPKPKPPTDDARMRLTRLYREIGISAVASALHMQALPSVEERAQAALASHDLPEFLTDEKAAA